MKKLAMLGFLAFCFISCDKKDSDIEQVAKQYSKDILSGNVEKAAKNARMPNGQALDSKQVENFIKEKEYLSQEYHFLTKQNGGLKEINIFDKECVEPQEKNICVVYLDLIFDDSTRVPMVVPLIEVDKKWYPVFEELAMSFPLIPQSE